MNQTPDRTPSRRLRARAGYTLLEVLIVLAVIGLILGIVGTSFMNMYAGAQADTTRTQIRRVKEALELMHLDIGRYPTDAEGLALLTQAAGDGAPGWSGPYMETVPLDGWKQPFIYAAPVDDSGPRVTSLGADKKEGGSGNNEDITL